jgi:hypothetical protein
MHCFKLVTIKYIVSTGRKKERDSGKERRVLRVLRKKKNSPRLNY